MEKGISTLIGIIIILGIAVILFGGVFTYQYFAIKIPPVTNVPLQKINQKTNAPMPKPTQINNTQPQKQNTNINQNTNQNTNQNQIECNTVSDCPSGSSCIVKGPIISNQPLQKICVPKGQAVTL